MWSPVSSPSLAAVLVRVIRGTAIVIWLAVGMSVPVAAGQTSSVTAVDDDKRCLQCHGREHIGELDPAERLSMVGTWLETEQRPADWVEPQREVTGEEPPTRPGLFIRKDALIGSVHADIRCVQCHEDARQLPHAPTLNTQTCATTCHAKEAQAFPTGSHYEALKRGDAAAPTCASCHGGHQIVPISDQRSPEHRLNSIFLCSECHEKHQKDTPGGYKSKLHIEAYLQSAHGRAIAQSGLVAAPTCSDCHSAHAVHPVSDPSSPVHRDKIAQTCGRCHVGILGIYQKSIHGQKAAEGDEKAPVCTDCHTSHEIIQPDKVAFKLASGDRCGKCHADRIEHYRETFHGKALALGAPSVAACYDCHGHHDIVPLKDPASRLAGANKVETCRQCHPGATEKFTEYIAHADHTNRKLYPTLYWTFVFMTAIVVGTFLFFGAHTILWFVRSMVLYIRDRKKFVEIKRRASTDEETFVRFKPFDRFLHVLVMTSFLLLVATGMPLKFYYTDWAKQVVWIFGGLEAAGQLHRLGAVVTFLYFALHIASLARRGYMNRAKFKDARTGKFSIRAFLSYAFGPDLPYPHIQDVKDWWAHQKWFFGRGPQPQFDKWTYWEKFDYMAVFWGVAVIGLSGLVMWFPVAFTHVLPGWIINIALIVHSDEALLAAGFIFAFHFFNVHFRPEKFPIDSVIFSGRISKTEMLHERRRWYDRLVAADALDSIRIRDEWKQWRRVIHPMGFTAFGLGLVLLVLIVYAMSSRLLGLPGHSP
ncbi:MAG: cytochrome b/b6 domain-containing protein [Phycisphaerales bacterium]|nr:cytochrome b/b6 domain-containing protein [Phycisphaerales bacterium]